MSKRATLAEVTAHTIREAILRGDYLSGERLVELSLAESMKVSQNTVRDALRILELDGWVVKRPRHGVYVRQFTTEEAAEIFALIGAVEPLALGWMMEHIAEQPAPMRQQTAELRRLLEGARRDAYIGQTGAVIEKMFGFHEHIAALAAKPATKQLLEQLYNQVRLLEALRRVRAPSHPQELEQRITAHEALLRQIEAGDVEGARATLADQISTYSEMVSAALIISR
jgi:DNA-binding GntR family transcriptional regulator